MKILIKCLPFIFYCFEPSAYNLLKVLKLMKGFCLSVHAPFGIFREGNADQGPFIAGAHWFCHGEQANRDMVRERTTVSAR